MITKQLSRNDFENARLEIFHMILFALAWVMIGEYALNFGDYVAAAAIVLVAAIFLGMQSIKIYDLEDDLPDPVAGEVLQGRGRKKRFQRYVIIFMFEAAAIMATWMILLRLGHEDWLVPGFALIAGLHFIPLALVVKLNSYYLLGAWICLLAIAGYFLPVWGKLSNDASNALIAYGCAAGAIADGIWIVVSTRNALGKD